MEDFIPISRVNGSPWSHEDEDRLWLLTPEELEDLPEGSTLTSINGEVVTKGVDYIDDDIRFGYLAYGLKESQVVTMRQVGLED